MSQWYSIRPVRATARAAAAVAAGAAAAPVAAAEIFIYGDIGPSWWEETVTAANFVEQLQALKADEITVRLASIGGSVPDGLAIYNALKRHPAKVITSVDSIAYSIASLIAMAGDEVEMASNALMMIHAPWSYVAGNANELRDQAEVLDTYAKAMATSYAAKTGKSVDDVLAMWLADGRDHYFTAADAQADGLIDRITDPLPIAASGARGLDVSRFHTPGPMAAQLQSLGLLPPAAAAAKPPTERTPMPGNTTNPPAAEEAAVQAARQEGVRAESQRRADIKAQFAPFLGRADLGTEMATLQQQCEDDANCTPQAAGTKILAALAKGAKPLAGNHFTIETTEDESDKWRAAAVESVLARAALRSTDGKLIVASDANPLRGRRLLELARASLERRGVRTDGMDQMKVVGMAFTQTGSDFPVLLETAMYKTLQAGYALQPDTWSQFCSVGSVSDFRAANRYRVGSFGNLDAVNEAGEFKNKTIPDGEKASIKAGTKGNIINLTRQAIINDDLSVFSDLGQMLGRAARRTIEADVYALLASNPVLADGFALFSTQHKNLAPAGAAPSVAAYDEVRVSMGLQLDVSGNDYLDIRPAIWLGPLGLKGDADVVNMSEYDPDTAGKLQRPNKSRGTFSLVVGSPRLSGTAWYAFASPSEAPVIEVAFLDGVQTPFLDQEQGFTVDGTRWKVRLDYGLAPIDYRGAFRNPGA